MRWYVAALLACSALGTAFGLLEASMPNAAPTAETAIRWASIASVAFILCCCVLAVGCGAPGGRNNA